MAKGRETTRGTTTRTQRKVIKETAKIVEPVVEVPEKHKELLKVGMAKLGLKENDIFSYRIDGGTITFITVNARKLKYTLE